MSEFNVQDVFGEFPELSNYDEFNFEKCKENFPDHAETKALFWQMARYAIWLYSDRSPLAEISDIREAQQEALKKAKLKKEYRQQIVDGENDLVIFMGLRVMISSDNYLWMELCGIRATLHQIVAEAARPPVGDDETYDKKARYLDTMANKALPSFQKLAKRAKDIENELFGKFSKEAREALKKSKQSEFSTSAEAYAADNLWGN